MYHEEKIINGILCWRGTPQGEWIAHTPEELTEKLLRIFSAARLLLQEARCCLMEVAADGKANDEDRRVMEDIAEFLK